MNRRSPTSSWASPVELFRIGLLALLMVLVSLAAIQPVNAATIIVDTTAESPGAVGDCTLGEAIVAANTNAGVDGCLAGSGSDIIFLPAGNYDLTAALPTITITSDITIIGAFGTGAADPINQTGAARIFTVNAGARLRLIGLTLTGGDSATDGGAILNSGTLIIENSTLSGNMAANSGGAIRTNGGTVTIRDSILNNNTATALVGGAISINGGVVIIDGSTLSENMAGTNGGAIRNFGGTLTVTDSSISDNEAGGNGGGLSNASNGGFSIVNSTFGGNTATTDGGAIYSDSTLNSSINSATIADNEATVTGGGIFNAGAAGSVQLKNTILAENTAPTGPDCDGSELDSLDHNIFGDLTDCTVTLETNDQVANPRLDNFTDDGTPGNGHFPLLFNSPAIDAGDNGACPTLDQIGTARKDGDDDNTIVCDIGAIEPVSTAQPPVPISGNIEPKKTKFTFFYDGRDGFDRVSIRSFLLLDPNQTFAQPFDKDVLIQIELDDVRTADPNDTLLAFEQTVPAGTVSSLGGKRQKWRFTSRNPGINDLQFDKAQPDKVPFFLFVDKWDFLPADLEQDLTAIRRIRFYQLTVQLIDPVTSAVDEEWQGIAPLFKGDFNTVKQQLIFGP